MQALVSSQSRVTARALAVTALIWALVGAPGTAAADACAYASTGPDGTEAVARVSGWAGVWAAKAGASV
ncbi:hypothetical protein RM528_05055, partial [Streptomyces sp. DSM 41635]|nr:hypothetical protein [Streptomyces sp. DSM 41635]